MAAVQTTLFNSSGVAIVRGQVVRPVPNKSCTTALATSSAGVQGVIGVAGSGSVNGGPVQITIAGSDLVLLETGLTPVAGQTLYVSASVAGRATNVVPSSLATPIGTIEDTAQYAITGLVLAAIDGSSQTAGNTRITTDSINTNGVMLSAITSTNITEGAHAYVLSVGDEFRLEKSALVSDNINVVDALGKPGYKWVRLLQPNLANALNTAWSVDTAAGSDENDGKTDATALKTIQELKRRLWGLSISVSVTVRILTDTASTDIGVWNTTFDVLTPGFMIFLGVLGPSTGPNATPHDNTLYTGSLTSPPSVPSNTPSADDYQITDSAIPVSYTASGLLGLGVIFKRTNSTALYWYALKDLGNKTLRIANPNSGNGGAAGWTALNNGDTYQAFQAPKVYFQDFGAYAVATRFDSVHNPSASTFGQVIGGNSQWRRSYRSGAGGDYGAGLMVNVCINITSGVGIFYCRGEVETLPQLINMAFIGDGTNRIVFNNGDFGISGFTAQGIELRALDNAYISIEGIGASHDNTTTVFKALGRANITLQFPLGSNQGISGKGCTSLLVWVIQAGEFGYSGSGVALPPFNAASTSNANPIMIENTGYPVASMPAATETVITPVTYKNTLP